MKLPKSLSIIYTTSRVDPKFHWFADSLARQIDEDERITIHVFDFHSLVNAWMMVPSLLPFDNVIIQRWSPKPTIWQGPHRITKEDWWAKSNALNTGICLCQTEWIAFVDDRSVLGPHWLQSVREAMDGNYAVCGSYGKRANLYVDWAPDGQLIIGGEFLGQDTRTPGLYDFDSWYGGSGALPLEWCLAVNGFSEDLCDSLGSEDSMFGVTLRNSGYPIKYDSRMLLIEDRTPGQIDGALKRADKNSHLGQQAKSWAIVRAFEGKTTSQNSFDIRNLRDRVLLNGESLDSILPSASDQDWYDNQPIAEMI